MDTDNKSQFMSAGLSIDPQLGQLSNAQGESIRLTPINMKALLMLISKTGDVVSRSELFEEVWARQVVSDDTLTRCISDIRSQLRIISQGKNLIETLPKRGYRWLGEARDSSPEAAAGVKSSDAAEKIDHLPSSNDQPQKAKPFGFSALLTWQKSLISFIAYGGSLLLIASLIVGVYTMMVDREVVRVVVLPTKSSGAIDVLYLESINDELVRRLLQVEGVDVISRTAIEANAGNPFPYFSQQYGAQWVIESRVSANSSGRKLSLNLVDARSASIVNMKIKRYENNEEKLTSAFDEFISDSQQFLLSE